MYPLSLPVNLGENGEKGLVCCKYHLGQTTPVWLGPSAEVLLGLPLFPAAHTHGAQVRRKNPPQNHVYCVPRHNDATPYVIQPPYLLPGKSLNQADHCYLRPALR